MHGAGIRHGTLDSRLIRAACTADVAFVLLLATLVDAPRRADAAPLSAAPAAAGYPASQPIAAETGATSPSASASASRPISTPEPISVRPTGGMRATDVPTEEHRSFELINAARGDAGLAPLRLNTTLSSTARAQSQQMAATNSLFHTPDLQSVLDSAVPGWKQAGENVGSGADAQAVHNAYMNSPHHRDNILGPFSDVGVGAAIDGAGLVWITQQFVQLTSIANPLAPRPSARPTAPPATPRATQAPADVKAAAAAFQQPPGDTRAPREAGVQSPASTQHQPDDPAGATSANRATSERSADAAPPISWTSREQMLMLGIVLMLACLLAVELERARMHRTAPIRLPGRPAHS